MRHHGLPKQKLAHIDTERTCPDCVTGRLRLGPRGGMSINVRCSNVKCGKEFNIGLWNGQIVMAERLPRNAPVLYTDAILDKDTK